MLVLGNEVAKPEHGRWRGFHEVQFARAGDRVRGVAGVSCATERETAATRHVRGGCGAVAVIYEQAGAQMRRMADGIPIQVSFAGAQTELPFVGDPVVIETAAVLENVE